MSSWRSKSVITLAPGKHMLMSAHGGHYMEANVEAGKRYYVLLRFIYANGLQLRPLRATGTSEYRVNGPDFPKWMKATNRFVEKSPDAEGYFDSFKEGVDQAQTKGTGELAGEIGSRSRRAHAQRGRRRIAVDKRKARHE